MSRMYCVGLLIVSVAAHAQVYQRIDRITGHVTYTNTPPPGVEVETDPAVQPRRANPSVLLDKKPTARRREAKLTTPATFPRIDPAEQKKRDVDRRAILMEELLSEEKALDRLGPKTDDADAARRHRENIASLKRELANLQ